MPTSALELLDVSSGAKSGIDLLDQSNEKVVSALDLISGTAAPSTEVPVTPSGVPLSRLGYKDLKRLTRSQLGERLGTTGIVILADPEQVKKDYSNIRTGIENDFRTFINDMGKIAGGPEYASPIGTTIDSVLRGAERIILQIPGFALGAFGGIAKGTKEIIDQIALDNEINLKQLRDVIWQGYAEGTEALKPIADTMPATEGSEVVERIAFAPIEAIQTTMGQFASNFENYPNVQGALELTGDAVALYTYGKLVHGKTSRQEVVAETARVSNEAGKIVAKQLEVDGIPNDIVRQTQQRLVEVQKQQLENRAKELARRVSEEALIEEEIGRQAEGVEKARVIKPVEEVEVKPEVPDYKKEFGTVKPSEAEIQKMTEEYADQVIEKKKAKEKEVPKEEPVKEVDEQAGFDNAELKGEDSPFFQDKETTNTFMKIYDSRQKAVSEDVELFTQKMINDANQWYHGNDGIEIERLRNALSSLAGNAEQLRSEFLTGVDHFEWKQTVQEAAKWVRELERANTRYYRIGKLSLDKPQGLYIAREGTRIVEDLEGKRTNIDFNPKNPLKVESELLVSHARGGGYTIPASSGIKALKKLVPEEEFNRLMKLSKRELVNELSNKYPDINWNRLTDSYEVLEGYAGELAKREGYDSIIGDLDEAVVLKDSAIRKSSGTKLYSGIPLDEAAKEIVEGAKRVKDYMDKAIGYKRFKPLDAIKISKGHIVRDVFDRSGNARARLLDYGLKGWETVKSMILSHGGGAYSANMLEQLRKEVYSGLSKREKVVLDSLIHSTRMEDIAKYKTGFNFPEGSKPIDAISYINAFEYIEKLPKDRAELVRRRAEAYFEWMKKPLKDLADVEFSGGIITEQEYNDLASHNYKRLKTIGSRISGDKIVDIYDKKVGSSLGGRKRNIYDSGIEKLSRGMETDIFEPSSQVMALEVFNRAYGRIFNNLANLNLLKIAREDNNNPLVRIKEGKDSKIPKGWSRVFVYEEGVRKSIYLEPELYREWVTNTSEMTYKASQLLRYASLSPVLRTAATGVEWAFALSNLPRDIMHIWFAARTFEDGKWKPVYNPVLPIYGLQIGRDLAAVARDAINRGERYKQYLRDGGGMEFLVHQGRIFQRGKHVDTGLEPIYNVMGWLNETSEIITRLAVRERVIRREAAKRGITMEEARKNKDISREASFVARDYMDFGQGGSIAKAVDNAFPYTNAAIQATRGFVRSFKPGSGSALSSSFKMAQLASLTTGLTIAIYTLAPKTSKELEGDRRTTTNIVIPLGDEFGFLDEYGQKRYPFFKIPLDQSQRFFHTFFTQATRKWMGYNFDEELAAESLKDLSPLGISNLPPLESAALGYATNKDFWYNENVVENAFNYKLPKALTGEEYGGSEEEKLRPNEPGSTLYNDIGKVTGLSPARLKYATEELVTSNSTWAKLIYGSYDKVFSELPESTRQQSLFMALSKVPGIDRFFGVTNPHSKHRKNIDEKAEKALIERTAQNMEVDRLTDGYLYEGNVKRGEIFDYIDSFKDLGIRDRLRDRFKFEEAIKNLPEKSFWRRMKGLGTETRAKIFVDRLNSSDEAEKKQLWEEYAIVSKAGGIASDEFRKEVIRLRSE